MNQNSRLIWMAVGSRAPHLVFLVGFFYGEGPLDRTDLSWNCPILDAEIKKLSDRPIAAVRDEQVELCMGGHDHQGDRQGANYTLVCVPHETVYQDLEERDPEEQTVLGAHTMGAVYSPDVHRFAGAFIDDVVRNHTQSAV